MVMRAEKSLAQAFNDLRKLCLEEDYILEVPERVDRINTFAIALEDVSD
jgi:hypothetical protein